MFSNIEIIYQEASSTFRSVDTLTHNLLQYYSAIVAGTIALNQTGKIENTLTLSTIAIASIFGFFLTVRLRRNHKYLWDSLIELEKSININENMKPFTNLKQKISKFDINWGLGIFPTNYIYCLVYILGFSYAVYQY